MVVLGPVGKVDRRVKVAIHAVAVAANEYPIGQRQVGVDGPADGRVWLDGNQRSASSSQPPRQACL